MHHARGLAPAAVEEQKLQCTQLECYLHRVTQVTFAFREQCADPLLHHQLPSQDTHHEGGR